MNELTLENLPTQISKLSDSVSELKQLITEKNEKEINEKYLNISEAAKLLDLTKSTLYSKVNKNEITYCKRGKRLYFLRTDLMAYVEHGRNRSVVDFYKEKKRAK